MATNLLVQVPSRKPLKAGDIFSLLLAERGHVVGRVISTEARWTLADGAGTANLLYIYRGLIRNFERLDTATLTVERLLIPPVMTNRLGWSRGYFRNVASVPLAPHDVLPKHCFMSSHLQPRFFDEFGRELAGPVEPVGHQGLHSYRSIEDAVCNALGVPLAAD